MVSTAPYTKASTVRMVSAGYQEQLGLGFNTKLSLSSTEPLRRRRPPSPQVGNVSAPRRQLRRVSMRGALERFDTIALPSLVGVIHFLPSPMLRPSISECSSTLPARPRLRWTEFPFPSPETVTCLVSGGDTSIQRSRRLKAPRFLLYGLLGDDRRLSDSSLTALTFPLICRCACSAKSPFLVIMWGQM